MKRKRRGLNERRTITAAATRVRIDAKPITRPNQDWQRDAWTYADEVPEVKQLILWRGNQLAKLRLFVATLPPDAGPDADPVPVTHESADIPPDVAARMEAVLARFRSPMGGQPGLVRRAEQNLETVGECWVVGFAAREGTDGGEGTEEEWIVASISEVEHKNVPAPGADPKAGTWYVKKDEGDRTPRALDPSAGDELFRVWQPHSQWYHRADCAMRGVLSECESLQLLTNQIKAEARSRTAAGLLLIPNDLYWGARDRPVVPDEDDGEEDPFLDELANALVSPASDPTAAAAVVPFLLRGPPESLEKVRWVEMGRFTDRALEARMEARVTRLARGLDAPPEVVMGFDATTYANAAQVDEDTFNDYLDPRAVFLADAITVGYWRPKALDDQGIPPELAQRAFVWFDASALVAEPDREANADAALDRFAISLAAYRRAKGFSEDDAPSPEEVLVGMALKRGALAPNVAAALLDLLGAQATPAIDLPDPEEAPPANPAEDQLRALARALNVPAPNGTNGHRPALTAAPRRSSSRSPGRRLAAIDRELRTRLVVAADAAMDRALERAGNRLRSRASSTLRRVEPHLAAAHLGPTLVAEAGLTEADLLAGAWDGLQADFDAWVAGAQEDALAVLGGVAGLDAAQREGARLRQAQDRVDAWQWAAAALGALAAQRLYDPRPAAPPLGEHDPSLRVPPGLVRQSMARAGGAAGLEATEGGAWVVLRSGGTQPAGGVATGELARDLLSEGGVGIEGYEWDYGGARRVPFLPHLALDGVQFQNFDADVLANREGWPPFAYYMPGDHDGCVCDVIPVIIEPGA